MPLNKKKGKKPGVAGKANRPKDEDAGGFIDIDPDAAESAGLLNDCRVKVTASTYRYASKKDYREEPDDPTNPDVSIPVWDITLSPASEPEKEEHIILSLGSVARIRPSKDGEHLKPAPGSNAKGLSLSSNGYIMMKSLVENGFPTDKLRKGASSIVGLHFHLLRIPQPTRRGLPEPEEGESKGQRTVATCHDIYRFPWEKKDSNPDAGGPKAAGGKGKSKPKRGRDEDEEEEEEQDDDAEEPEEEDGDEAEDESDEEEEDSDSDDDSEEAEDEDADDDGDEDEEEESDEEEEEDSDDEDAEEEEEEEAEEDPLTTKAQAIVVSILESAKFKKKGITVEALVGAAFESLKKLKNEKTKKQIVALLQNKKFLKSGPWDFDGSKLTPAA